ncbi:type VI secretion system baseplate subunit TssK [Aureliella helgolandensis]|uniref:Type VI secretion protein n=1 Tax=Aureliella helgolandensis TaxID=2527968 RepID=A0A518G587_9BACT|nr:type VI secretion system baseplate subunit TssK [Aureliella helgolandensis]QDV23719.1 hypothetical protein Q31a_20240 [Aureliella helgolandensis]
MQTQPVHWHEGMFLRPQHFQVSTRYSQAISDRGDKWDQYYNWGLRSLEFDRDALSNYRLVVRSLEARYRDGTQVAIPDDLVLPAFDIKSALSQSGSVIVYLALPLLQSNRSNVGNTAAENLARFVIDTQNLHDENTGVNPQPIKIRRLNVKLLTSDHDSSGYELLPLAKLKRADRAEALPELDETFIPPLLACDAWHPLRASVLEPVYDRIGKKLEFLSGQIVSRNITFDSQGQGDRLLFEQLRAMNEIYAPLSVRLFAQGLHPLDAYLALSELVGKLAIFSGERRIAPLPQYDHDDLAGCFWRAKQQIDACLDIVVEPEYSERSLIGAGMRMQVAMEPAWLEMGKKIFVGVHTSLTPDECERLLTRGLDMKIGSSTRVDEIFRTGSAGLKFSYCHHQQRALPRQPGLLYFEIDRASQEQEWTAVKKSLTLALRLNENLIAGNIQGERTLTIRVGGETTSLKFTVYVVPEE